MCSKSTAPLTIHDHIQQKHRGIATFSPRGSKTWLKLLRNHLGQCLSLLVKCAIVRPKYILMDTLRTFWPLLMLPHNVSTDPSAAKRRLRRNTEVEEWKMKENQASALARTESTQCAGACERALICGAQTISVPPHQASGAVHKSRLWPCNQTKAQRLWRQHSLRAPFVLI